MNRDVPRMDIDDCLFLETGSTNNIIIYFVFGSEELSGILACILLFSLESCVCVGEGGGGLRGLAWNISEKTLTYPGYVRNK
jgi:hypothetical protein